MYCIKQMRELVVRASTKLNVMDRIDIEINANIIWHILCESNEELSIHDLHKTSGLSVVDIYISIGWLAREGKIVFRRNNNANDYYNYTSQRFYF